MTTRMKPKWLDTTESEIGCVLIADGYGAALVSDIIVHEHDNFDLLSSYTQLETDLANAVSYTHQHLNQATLDSYTQTETALASAVQATHNRNQDTGTTNANFTLNSATYPIVLTCNVNDGVGHLTIYDVTKDELAKVKIGILVVADALSHVGEYVGFFDTAPVAKTEVELTVEENDIGDLLFNQTTYTATEIEALRDKCEALAEDVRALHNALTAYGLI